MCGLFVRGLFVCGLFVRGLFVCGLFVWGGGFVQAVEMEGWAGGILKKAMLRGLDGDVALICADPSAFEPLRCEKSCTRTTEEICDGVAFVAPRTQQAFEQGQRFLGRIARAFCAGAVHHIGDIIPDIADMLGFEDMVFVVFEEILDTDLPIARVINAAFQSQPIDALIGVITAWAGFERVALFVDQDMLGELCFGMAEDAVLSVVSGCAFGKDQ